MTNFLINWNIDYFLKAFRKWLFTKLSLLIIMFFFLNCNTKLISPFFEIYQLYIFMFKLIGYRYFKFILSLFINLYLYFYLGQFSHGDIQVGNKWGTLIYGPESSRKFWILICSFFQNSLLDFFYRFGEKNAFISWAKMQIFFKNWA